MFATWLDEIRDRNERDTDAATWANEHELLAAIGTLVSQLNRTLVAVNSKRGARLPELWKVRRPGEPERPPAISPRQLAQLHMRG